MASADTVTGESRDTELWEGKNRWGENQVDEGPKLTGDERADLGAIVTVLVCTVLMAIHFASGWTFDI